MARPGKFEGAADQDIAEYLYDIIGWQGTDEEEGSVTEWPFTWFGLLTNVAEMGGLSYIVSEDEQGFFDYEEFDTAEEAKERWDEIIADIRAKEDEMALEGVPEEDLF